MLLWPRLLGEVLLGSLQGLISLELLPPLL
jgi:hypothetical protein